jgi:hypothetical protein
MSHDIDIAEYRYEEIYPSFKAGTDEKELTGALNGRLLRGLLRRGLIPARPLKVADIGSGPCDTILKYLAGLNYAPGFRIRATDFSIEYAHPEHGKAVATLAQAQRDAGVKIVDFAVKPGDGFAGRLLDLLSASAETDERQSFDLVFASHMLYHAGGQRPIEVMLNDVVTNLLNDLGILVLYHAAPVPGTFNYFRSRFGRHSAVLERSDTPAVNVDDAVADVAACCTKDQFPYLEMAFSARLALPGLTDYHWRQFRLPERYAQLQADDPAAAENLKRLLFVTQRAPLEFAADHSASGLDAYLTEVRAVIETEHGYLPLAERLQVVCRPDAPPRLLTGLREALAEARAPSSSAGPSAP